MALVITPQLHRITITGTMRLQRTQKTALLMVVVGGGDGGEGRGGLVALQGQRGMACESTATSNKKSGGCGVGDETERKMVKLELKKEEEGVRQNRKGGRKKKDIKKE